MASTSLAYSAPVPLRNGPKGRRAPPAPPAPPAPRELFEEMGGWPIVAPPPHIAPRPPAARDFDEVLGYHYYTELAHSAGMPADLVAPGLDPRTRARNLAGYLDR